MQKQIEVMITLYGQHSRWGIIDRKRQSPTLTASMGMGGGLIPMVTRKIKTKKKKVINPFKGISPWGWHWEQQVYDRKGIARTIKSGEGSGNTPKVIKRWKGK